MKHMPSCPLRSKYHPRTWGRTSAPSLSISPLGTRVAPTCRFHRRRTLGLPACTRSSHRLESSRTSPDEQEEQLVAPAELYLPAGQATCSEEPSDTTKLPASTSAHELEPDDEAYCPLLQSVQTDAAEPENVPGSHVVSSDAPDDPTKEPALLSTHVVAPEAGAKLPGEQSSQDVAPAELYLPEGAFCFFPRHHLRQRSSQRRQAYKTSYRTTRRIVQLDSLCNRMPQTQKICLVRTPPRQMIPRIA